MLKEELNLNGLLPIYNEHIKYLQAAYPRRYDAQLEKLGPYTQEVELKHSPSAGLTNKLKFNNNGCPNSVDFRPTVVEQTYEDPQRKYQIGNYIDADTLWSRLKINNPTEQVVEVRIETQVRFFGEVCVNTQTVSFDLNPTYLARLKQEEVVMPEAGNRVWVMCSDSEPGGENVTDIVIQGTRSGSPSLSLTDDALGKICAGAGFDLPTFNLNNHKTTGTVGIVGFSVDHINPSFLDPDRINYVLKAQHPTDQFIFPIAVTISEPK